ncbi:unnamed protein product [Citrullus colocynthis]|uniref:Uncharacterized protein n=1 Tax=Citrullus colocynthis TaxID=252529 RepID=A0ABP0XSZ5_9ROSI
MRSVSILVGLQVPTLRLQSCWPSSANSSKQRSYLTRHTHSVFSKDKVINHRNANKWIHFFSPSLSVCPSFLLLLVAFFPAYLSRCPYTATTFCLVLLTPAVRVRLLDKRREVVFLFTVLNATLSFGGLSALLM